MAPTYDMKFAPLGKMQSHRLFIRECQLRQVGQKSILDVFVWCIVYVLSAICKKKNATLRLLKG